MICKGINTSTINISLTYSLRCWYIGTADGDIVPGTTPVYSPISHKTSCADLCCYVSAAVLMRHIPLSFYTASSPDNMTVEFQTSHHYLRALSSRFNTLYPRTWNQAILFADIVPTGPGRILLQHAGRILLLS